MKENEDRKQKGSPGFTIPELLMVIAIFAILIAMGVFYYGGWQDKYNLETQIRDLHVDLMNARVRALGRNRAHFVVLTGRQYTLYEDTSPPPDGNGVLNTTAPNMDTEVYQKDLRLKPEYTLTWSDPPAAATVGFTNKGLADPEYLHLADDNRAICLKNTMSVEYDCLVMTPTRINLGRIKNKDLGADCEVTNCEDR